MRDARRAKAQRYAELMAARWASRRPPTRQRFSPSGSA